MNSNYSMIQRTADQIFQAALLEMDEVREHEQIHGQCFNFRREPNTDVWIFLDKFELRIARTL